MKGIIKGGVCYNIKSMTKHIIKGMPRLALICNRPKGIVDYYIIVYENGEFSKVVSLSAIQRMAS